MTISATEGSSYIHVLKLSGSLVNLEKGNYDSASLRLEQLAKDDPAYLGGAILNTQLYKSTNKGTVSKYVCFGN